MAHTDHHVRPSRRVQRVLGIRSSGASGPHRDTRQRRARTRSAAVAAALRAEGVR